LLIIILFVCLFFVSPEPTDRDHDLQARAASREAFRVSEASSTAGTHKVCLPTIAHLARCGVVRDLRLDVFIETSTFCCYVAMWRGMDRCNALRCALCVCVCVCVCVFVCACVYAPCVWACTRANLACTPAEHGPTNALPSCLLVDVPFTGELPSCTDCPARVHLRPLAPTVLLHHLPQHDQRSCRTTRKTCQQGHRVTLVLLLRRE
jgi:hypothetical protein